jgi:transposase-like protein
MKCNDCKSEMVYNGIDSDGEKFFCTECNKMFLWKLT